MKTLIKRQMRIATQKFFDVYADKIFNMIVQGYQDGILHTSHTKINHTKLQGK